MNIEQWEMSEALAKELEAHYKTTYALDLVTEEPIAIAKALTFDHFAPAVTFEELQKFLTVLNTSFLEGAIRGVGIEVGSGPGTFVAAFASMSTVQKMYGVEACRAIVEKLMSKVVTALAQKDAHKIVGAVADFDHLNVPDESVDFVFDFFSLHHSPNIAVTLTEIARVLKPGGVLICVDKARADILLPTQLDALLDTAYSPEAKKMMGLDPNIFHTRRMNGEFEYRRSDWERHMTQAGLVRFTHYNVARRGGNVVVRYIKKILSYLPLSVQIFFSRYISKTVANHLEPSHRIFTNMLPSYGRDFSLFYAWKK